MSTPKEGAGLFGAIAGACHEWLIHCEHGGSTNDCDSLAWRVLDAITPVIVADRAAAVELLLRAERDAARPRSDHLAHRKDGGHWLRFIDGKVTGCFCGFAADVEADSGYGDSVLDHFEDVVRAEERARAARDDAALR